MIHLAGESPQEVLRRALNEIALFEKNGVDAIIIEDYHGGKEDVINVLDATNNSRYKIIRGVNLLSDPYASFALARKYGAQFVQLDSVQLNDLSIAKYNKIRDNKVVVLGGIRFKYTNPTEKSLEDDLDFGKRQCDAIVTTGNGTGKETPLQKLKGFRNVLRDYPLIVGAGVTAENVYEQLCVADGAIVGSYFKNGDTTQPVIRERVQSLMDIVNRMR